MELTMFFKQFVDGKPVGYLITEENLRYVLSHVDFNSNPPPKYFESLGYAVVIPTDMPAITPYQTATEYETENEDGTWQQNWQVAEVSAAEQKKLFDTQLKNVKDEQNRLLGIYAVQLKDPNEPPEELIVIQNWINATKAMDLSDPFNVVWPTHDWPGLSAES
jgi:hypothetical protein